MKRAGIVFLLIILMSGNVLADVSGSTVDPSEIGVGARPLALGRSFVGFSDDASDIFINPAGLARIRTPKAVSMTGQLLQDINYTVIGGANPTDWGTFGIGYINVGLSRIPLTTITGSPGSEEVIPAGSTNYFASVTTLSYSNELSKIDLFKDYRNITYGLNLKYFTQGFTGGGSLVSDAGGTGMDMDIGIQYRPRKELTLGCSVLNALPEGLGGRFTWAKGNVVENIPALIKLGGTAKMFGKDSYYGGNQSVYLGLDLDMHPTQPRPAVYHIGAEWWPISVMALRVGIDQQPKGTDAGVGVDNNLTGGIGLKYNGYTFDYCYHQFSDLSDNTTHFFSIGYVGKDDSLKPMDEKKRAIPIIVASASLENFSDVGQGHWAKNPIELMATLNVMNGYHDGKFRPDEKVSRAELAYMLIKLKGSGVSDVSSDPFSDVSRNHWAAKYIKAASDTGLMTSYPDGTFRPDSKVTRIDGVVILSRFTQAQEPANIQKDPYVDVSRANNAARYLVAAQSYGLLDYLIGKKFEPNKELSRAEVAEILSKTGPGKDKIRSYLQTAAR